MTMKTLSGDMIAIGKIGAPHGVRGEVRVLPLTDFPERFTNTPSVQLEDSTVLKIDEVRFHKNAVLIKFAGFDSIDSVKILCGKLIHVSEGDLMPLPEGHYYHFQLIGLRVFDEDGLFLGTISDILETGSNDVYVIDAEGQKPKLIPAIKDVVKMIDVSDGRMVIRLQEEA